MSNPSTTSQLEGLTDESSGGQAGGGLRQELPNGKRSAREMLGDAADVADHVQQSGLVGLFEPLENASPSVYVGAMLGSILFSLALFLTGRRWAGIFVGLWAPTILNLGLYLKQLRPSHSA